MMMPSPVTAKIYYKRCSRDQEKAIIKNAALHRNQKREPEVHLVDGTVIRARKSDREAYAISSRKKRYGYLAVLILSSDGFPEAAGHL